jgi:hypothetical protein
VYPVPNYMLSSYLATIFQPPQFVWMDMIFSMTIEK